LHVLHMTYMTGDELIVQMSKYGLKDRNLVRLIPVVREEISSLIPLLPTTPRRAREKLSSAINLSLHAAISPSQAITILGVSPSTITTYLHTVKSDVEAVLERQRELARKMIKEMRIRQAWIAVDTTKIPYYGRFQRFVFNDERGSPCLLYATAVAVSRQSYIPLTIWQLDFPVLKTDIIEIALKSAEELKLRPSGVLLDRYFYDVAVVNYLRNHGVRFIIGAKKTAKVKKLVDNLPKEAVLVTPYRMRSGEGKTADVWLVAFWKGEKLITLIASDAETASKAPLYFKRARVETFHRDVKRFKPKTASRNFHFRWLLIALSFLIVTIYLYWMIRGRSRRGSIIGLDGLRILVFFTLLSENTSRSLSKRIHV